MENEKSSLKKFQYECIILAGGNSWRLQPDTYTPKPMLKIGEFTLLERQIDWLKHKGFSHIIVAAKEEFKIIYNKTHGVEFSIETTKLGTGGAVKQALQKATSDIIYVINVDDICNYNPLDMFMACQLDACVLVSKPVLNSAITTLDKDLIVDFVDKPKLNMYTSTGHYIFKRHVIETLFPTVGSFEDTVLPKLAKENKLNCLRLKKDWVTVNTMKEYIFLKENYEAIFLNNVNKA